MTKVPVLGKCILWGASGLFHCGIIGNLLSDFGDLPISDLTYYYSLDGIANILSLAILLKIHCIYMDTSMYYAFYVFDENRQYLQFYKCQITNLYWLDIKKPQSEGVIMTFITVKGRKEEHSSLDYSRAKKLRELQHMLVCPSNNSLASAIENNVIVHNSFAQRDIKIAKNIFGPSVPGLKRKTVNQKSKLPQTMSPSISHNP